MVKVRSSWTLLHKTLAHELSSESRGKEKLLSRTLKSYEGVTGCWILFPVFFFLISHAGVLV